MGLRKLLLTFPSGGAFAEQRWTWMLGIILLEPRDSVQKPGLCVLPIFFLLWRL